MRSKRHEAAKEPCTRWRALRLRTVSQVLDREGGEPRESQAEKGEKEGRAGCERGHSVTRHGSKH